MRQPCHPLFLKDSKWESECDSPVPLFFSKTENGIVNVTALSPFFFSKTVNGRVNDTALSPLPLPLLQEIRDDLSKLACLH